MEVLALARKRVHLSQRRLASKAGLSFRTVQLMEGKDRDIRLSSLQKVAQAMGLPKSGVERSLRNYFAQPAGSVFMCSHCILQDGSDSWPLHLMDFVEHFRAHPDLTLVHAAPLDGLDQRLGCLLASTVEHLCHVMGLEVPDWCRAIGALSQPWFVSGVENLKAISLIESPVEFRKRNIFVLGNFLDRV